jgi:hypothetical protein
MSLEAIGTKPKGGIKQTNKTKQTNKQTNIGLTM